MWMVSRPFELLTHWYTASVMRGATGMHQTTNAESIPLFIIIGFEESGNRST